MGRRKISLGFTDEHHEEGLHICYLYRDEEEKKEVLARYHEQGCLDNEKGLCLVDTVSPEEMKKYFIGAGVDETLLERNLEIKDAVSVYCTTQGFSIKRMLKKLESFCTDAVSGGYSGARISGEMSWATRPGTASGRDLLEYEARVNLVAGKFPFIGCCQYNVSLFSGKMIMDILRVHPAMIVRGRVVRNPYYVRPEEFIRQLNV